MPLFRRGPEPDEDGVQWLPSRRLRVRRRLWPVWLALGLGAVCVVFSATVLLAPKRPAQPAAPPSTPPILAPAPAPAAPPTPPDTSAANGPSPIAPLPPPATAPAQQPEAAPAEAATPEPAPQAPAAAPPADATTPAQQENAAPDDQSASSQSALSGAFPPARGDDDPDGANFAAYLNEAAPDQSGALALAVEAQRRYSGALDGARFTYKRVRVNDGNMWRLRVSGLTRERAQKICDDLTAAGAACEVGPN